MLLSLNSGLVKKLTAAKLVDGQKLSELSSNFEKYETAPLALVSEGLLSTDKYLKFCDKEFHAPSFDIANLDLSLVYQQEENKHLILEYHVIPVSLDKQNLTLNN